MAVPADQIEMVLGPMRGQLDQARSDGAEQAAPDDLAEATSVLDQMEELAGSCADVGEWSTRLAAENWWPRFTEPLTRLLSATARAALGGGDGPPDDDQLLANTLAAYRSALDGLTGTADEERIRPVLSDIVALAGSGISYPGFLRELELRGWTQVLAGLVVPTREQLQADVTRYRSQQDRPRQAKAQALVQARDELVAANSFGAVDPFEWELVSTRLDWEWEPAVLRDDAVVERIRAIFILLGDWVDSFTARAPADERWAAGSEAATRHRLERTRQCNPGFLGVRLAQLEQGFGLDFTGLLADPTFPRARIDFDLYLGDERVELARAVQPLCLPGAQPPADLVRRADELLSR